MGEDLYRFVSEDMKTGPSLELLLKVAYRQIQWEPILNDSKDNIVGFSATLKVPFINLGYTTPPGPLNIEIYKPGDEYKICLKDGKGVLAEHHSPAVEELYLRVKGEFQSKLDSDFTARMSRATDILNTSLTLKERPMTYTRRVNEI